MSGQRKVGLAIMAALVVLAIVVTLNSGPSKRAAPPLQASVKLSMLTVEVHNQDRQDWNNVRVRLSDKYFCPPHDSLESSKSMSIALATCASPSGERFVPMTMSPTNVVVTAVLTEDTGEAMAAFAPNR